MKAKIRSEAADIYDSFPKDGKNMSKAAFIKEYNRLTSQKGMQQDLARIVNGKRERGIIDRAVRG